MVNCKIPINYKSFATVCCVISHFSFMHHANLICIHANEVCNTIHFMGVFFNVILSNLSVLYHCPVF